MIVRRAVTVLLVALGTCAGGLLWLADGDATAALRPALGAGRELARLVGVAG